MRSCVYIERGLEADAMLTSESSWFVANLPSDYNNEHLTQDFADTTVCIDLVRPTSFNFYTRRMQNEFAVIPFLN